MAEPRHNLAALLCRRLDDSRGGGCRPSGEQAALELWKAVLQDDPEYLPSRLSLARSLAASGDAENAIVHFRKVVELQPDYIGARVQLADELTGQGAGALDEALQHLSHALELQPDNFDIHERMGDIERTRGRRQDASSAYQSALALTVDKKSKKRIRGKLDLLGG